MNIKKILLSISITAVSLNTLAMDLSQASTPAQSPIQQSEPTNQGIPVSQTQTLPLGIPVSQTTQTSPHPLAATLQQGITILQEQLEVNLASLIQAQTSYDKRSRLRRERSDIIKDFYRYLAQLNGVQYENPRKLFEALSPGIQEVIKQRGSLARENFLELSQELKQSGAEPSISITSKMGSLQDLIKILQGNPSY